MKTLKLLSVSALLIGAFCFGKTYQDKHPHMNAAKLRLEEAKNQLQKASSTYNGHRVKAIEYVDLAIKEINEGLSKEK